MAIIRIKRTTGNSLPTGLTFGEMAFIGRTGGATANRLYIAGPEGVCVWIGAEILNSPVFWRGLTAQTTIPTVQGVDDRVVAGGGVTFANDLSVNIAAGKFFGKYTRGDTIPARGQTVKWVIEDALVETITPTVPAVGASPQVQFGQTSGSVTVSVGYTIRTVGASAASATLEFRYGTGTWTTLSTALKDDTKGTDQAYSANYTHNFNRLTDSGADGRWGSLAFNYRYTVIDTAGASASNTGGFSPTTSANPTINWSPSGVFGITAASLRTGVFGATTATESNQNREKGNTFSTVNFTISRGNQYIPLVRYVLQSAEYVNGAWSAWTDRNVSGAITGNPTSVTSSGLTFRPNATGASLDRMKFRVKINDDYYDGTGSNPGTTFDSSESPEVTFNYMIFYGATIDVPSTAAGFRGLCSGLIAGSDTVNFGTGASSITSLINPFQGLNGDGTVNTKYIIAFPDSVTLTSVLDSGNSFAETVNAFNFGGAPNTTWTQIPDASGSLKNYNVYIMSVAVPYNQATRYHVVTRSTAAVTQP